MSEVYLDSFLNPGGAGSNVLGIICSPWFEYGYLTDLPNSDFGCSIYPNSELGREDSAHHLTTFSNLPPMIARGKFRNGSFTYLPHLLYGVI